MKHEFLFRVKSWPQWNQWEFCHWLQWGQDFSLDAHDIFFLTFRMMKQPWFWLAQGINSITQLEQNSNQTSGIFADAALFCRAVCSWRDPNGHLESRASSEPPSLGSHLGVHGEQRVSEHGGIQSYVLWHTFFQREFFIKGTLDVSQLVTKLGLDS